MTDLPRMVDLLAERLGGAALATSDDFFASMHNLVKPGRGVFVEDEYTDRGKWMDGWESRRRRDDGHDWCVLRLGAAGVPRVFCVDTNHFRGNHPEACSIDVLESNETDPERLARSGDWTELVGRSALQGHSENMLQVTAPRRCTHVRLNIYPDGGVARLRAYGLVDRPWHDGESGDLAAVRSGGRVLACSDEFFGRPLNMLMPGPAANMGDGWETKRRRGPGHDWVMLRLGARGRIEAVEVDTSHFKGNFPARCALEGADVVGDHPPEEAAWVECLPSQLLRADSDHRFAAELVSPGPFTHVRFNIYPDGGIARLRIRGTALP